MSDLPNYNNKEKIKKDAPAAPEKTTETQPEIDPENISETRSESVAKVVQQINEISNDSPTLTPPTAASTDSVSNEEEKQLTQAIEMAFTDGIKKSVEWVRKSGNAHLIDAFHDKLVDELYQRLVQSGKLKQEK